VQQPGGREQVLDRVVAEHRGEDDGDRGRCAIEAACASGTPCAVSPLVSAGGSVLARPAIISEKKMPMDSDMPEFWKVDRIPEAAPRSWAGTEDMMAAVFGAANRPDPIPLPRISSANAQ